MKIKQAIAQLEINYSVYYFWLFLAISLGVLDFFLFDIPDFIVAIPIIVIILNVLNVAMKLKRLE